MLVLENVAPCRRNRSIIVGTAAPHQYPHPATIYFCCTFCDGFFMTLWFSNLVVHVAILKTFHVNKQGRKLLRKRKVVFHEVTHGLFTISFLSVLAVHYLYGRRQKLIMEGHCKYHSEICCIGSRGLTVDVFKAMTFQILSCLYRFITTQTNAKRHPRHYPKFITHSRKFRKQTE